MEKKTELNVHADWLNEDFRFFLAEEEYNRALNDSDYLRDLVNQKVQARETQVEGNPHREEEEAEKNGDKGFIWPHEGVLLLLATYKEKEHEFSLGKKRHAKIWEEIARTNVDTNEKIVATSKQCQTKISGLKKTYLAIKGKDGKRKTGNGAIAWPYYEIMDDIFGKKSWVNPPAIATSDGPEPPCRAGPSQSTETIPKKRRVEAILEDFIKNIKQERESSKQEREKEMEERKKAKVERERKLDEERRQRYAEKMELQRTAIDLMKKLVEKNQ